MEANKKISSSTKNEAGINTEKNNFFQQYNYKILLVSIIGIGIIVYIIYSILTAPKNMIFAAYFFNNTSNHSSTDLKNNFIKHLELDPSDTLININTSLCFSEKNVTSDISKNINHTMVDMYNGKLDVIIGDSETIDFFSYGEYFHNVTEILPADLLEQFEDNLYYSVINEDGTKVPVGIYVDDSPLLNKYSYYKNSKPVLCFVLNSKNMDNAIEFLNYLYLEH